MEKEITKEAIPVSKESRKKKDRVLKGKHKDLIFYCALMAIPVVQFCIFYIGVNFNSILLSFQKIDLANQTTTWTFSNFTELFKQMTGSLDMLYRLRMSLLTYVLALVIGTPLGLLFSYYIYKKMPATGTFRVLLFLPSIISAIVMVTIYRYFTDSAIPSLLTKLTGNANRGLIENEGTRFATIMFYNIWISFGASVLMYSNGMSGINQEIVESAHLDGATGIREFWHITLPLVWPVLSTFLITGIAGIFTDQRNLYSFFGNGTPTELQTYGYYLYRETQTAASRADYPPLAAMGLMMTVVVVPLTLIVRWALEKFGPKED